jgi:glutamate N-acetyltransferase/amino-acid N-acetyltransferase
MATMLSYILTDLDIPKSTLDQLLKDSIKSTFNCISVDSDQSTSDTVLLISSQSKKSTNYDKDIELFIAALKDICKGLSEDIVRNGEGTQYFFIFVYTLYICFL